MNPHLQPRLRLEFVLPKTVLEEAAQARWSPDEHPAFFHFEGDLQVRYGDLRVPAKPISTISLADVALQVAELLMSNFFAAEESASFTISEQEDHSQIAFIRNGDEVNINAYHVPGHVVGGITAPADTVASACREMVAEFCALALPVVPDLLSWGELSLIRRLLETDEETRRLLDRYSLDGVPTSKLD